MTALELADGGGELERPLRVNCHTDVIRAKGEEYEATYLERLSREGCGIVEIERANGSWNWGRMDPRDHRGDARRRRRPLPGDLRRP